MSERQNEARGAALRDADRKWIAIYHAGDENWPVIEQAAIEHGFDAGHAHATAEMRWIIVADEGCPPDNGYYLATVGSVGIDISETTCHELNWFKGKWYLTGDEMIEMGPVIAWMRKPTPWEPKENEPHWPVQRSKTVN